MFGRLQRLARRVHDALGAPLDRHPTTAPAVAPRPPALPPVFLFVDGARGREIVPRIEALCQRHGITAQLRDIGDDEAMREFVLREARIDRDDLPTLFVASTHLGGHVELLARDAAGTLGDDLRKP